MLERVFNFKHLPIGVDLGSGSVKIAQARSWSSPEVVASARLEFESQGIATMSHEQIQTLARQIVQRVNSTGFSSRRCVIGLDDRLVRTRSVRQPPMPAAEIESAIAIDGRSRLGFSQEDQCELGWLLAGPTRQGDQVRDEVILIGSLSRPIESLVMSLAESGLRTIAVEPGFVAAGRMFTRSLRRTSDADVTTLVVDIGRTMTGITILCGNRITFHKSIELGGAKLEEAARQRLGLDSDAIAGMRRARLRRTPGEQSISDPKVERAFFESARSIISDLAHEVTLCLRYFSVTFRGGKPNHVYLIGGDANEPGLCKQISEAVGVEARVGDSPNSAGPVDASWAVAAGLSIRGAEPTAKRNPGRAQRQASLAPAASDEPSTGRRAA